MATEPRSDEAIRADVRYLNDHEAQTGRRSSAHVLLTHDVEPLLARVSELERENKRLHGVIAHTASDVRDYVRAALADARTERDATLVRAERAEAQLHEIEALCDETTYGVACQEDDCGDWFDAVRCVDVRDALAAGLSLQEERDDG